MSHEPSAQNPSLVVVATGGDPHELTRFPPDRPAHATVVAVDGGLERVLAARWHADHVVGDLDSVSPEALAAATAAGATVHRHAADKDATDLELALNLVVDQFPGSDVLVVGPGGGRLDHLLADISAIAAEGLAGCEVTAHLGLATITIVRPGLARPIPASAGEQVSLLPVHGHARSVTTTGLRWPLVDADLRAGTSRAMSNEVLDDSVSVSVATGVLAVIQPGTRAPAVSSRSTPYNPTPRGVFDDR